VAAPSWLDEVKRLVEQVSASDATEVRYARDGFRVRIKRRPGIRPSTGAETPSTVEPDVVAVVAPLTGIFYPGASPTAPPYVGEGDLVRPETVVGLIETMKIFNEVVAERHGQVRQILVEAGQLVHAGDRLLTLDEVAGEPAGTIAGEALG
jgi:multidrug efflux pump subunit AcrA (membrane-fusion protein)